MKHRIISFMLLVVLLSFFSTIHAQQPERQIPPQKQNQLQRGGPQVATDKKQQNNTSQKYTALPLSTLSLKDTKDWLREKITSYAGATFAQGNITFSYRYDAVRFERNTLTFNVTTRATIPDWYKAKNNVNYPGLTEIRMDNSVTFELFDIDPANIKVNKLPDGKSFGVVLNTLGGKTKIFTKSKIHTNLQTCPVRAQDLYMIFRDNTLDTSDAHGRLTVIFPDEEIANRVANAFIHAVSLAQAETEPFKTDPDNKKKNSTR